MIDSLDSTRVSAIQALLLNITLDFQDRIKTTIVEQIGFAFLVLGLLGLRLIGLFGNLERKVGVLVNQQLVNTMLELVVGKFGEDKGKKNMINLKYLIHGRLIILRNVPIEI